MNDGSLAGCGVLVTRPAHQAQVLVEAIEAAGGRAVRFPVLAIAGRDDARIQRAYSAMPTPDIVVFVSANAVAHGLAAVRASKAKIAAIGPATRAAIEAAGASVDIFPEAVFDSEHLLEHAVLRDVDGKHILVVCGQSGRRVLADTLAGRGAKVEFLRVYDRLPHTPSAAELDALETDLRTGGLHFVVAMSADTIEQLVAILPSPTRALLRQTALVAPSARVLQTASALLPGITTVLASGPQAPAIVEALRRQRQNGQNS